MLALVQFKFDEAKDKYTVGEIRPYRVHSGTGENDYTLSVSKVDLKFSKYIRQLEPCKDCAAKVSDKLSEDLLTGLGLDRYFNYKKDIAFKECRKKNENKPDELKLCP